MKKSNVTARIGEEFDKQVKEIKDERISRGIDTTRKSTREITNVMTRHRDFNKIKEDTIKLNLEKFKHEKKG